MQPARAARGRLPLEFSFQRLLQRDLVGYVPYREIQARLQVVHPMHKDRQGNPRWPGQGSEGKPRRERPLQRSVEAVPVERRTTIHFHGAAPPADNRFGREPAVGWNVPRNGVQLLHRPALRRTRFSAASRCTRDLVDRRPRVMLLAEAIGLAREFDVRHPQSPILWRKGRKLLLSRPGSCWIKGKQAIAVLCLDPRLQVRAEKPIQVLVRPAISSLSPAAPQTGCGRPPRETCASTTSRPCSDSVLHRTTWIGCSGTRSSPPRCEPGW